MKKSQYLSAKSRLEAELEQAQATTDSIRRRLDALNLVWAEIFCPENGAADGATTTSSPIQSNGTAPDPVPEVEPGPLAEIIDKIALERSTDFGVQQVLREFPNYGMTVPNRTTVAGRLKHLVSEGKLILVTQGQGRQPSIFRRAAINGEKMT